MPLLSIIVPVYNVAEYLDECLQSILSQTLTDWELFLVDDGSTDNSGEICDTYSDKDPRIHVMHVENGGQARARNIALGMASGKYITFVDSDDYLSNNEIYFIATQILQDDHRCDIVQFAYLRFEKGMLVSLPNVSEHTLHTPREYIENLELSSLKKNRTICGGPWAKVYRRELFDKIRFPEGMFYEDTYMLCDLFDISSGIKIIPTSGYIYRIREGSTTTRPPQERYVLDRINMQLRILESLLKYSENKRLIGDFVYDLVACFARAKRLFGVSGRYCELLDVFEHKLSPTFPIWDIRTLTKCSIIQIFGVNGLIKLTSWRRRKS